MNNGDSRETGRSHPIKTQNRVGDIAQLVECWSSMHDLGPIPTTTNTRHGSVCTAGRGKKERSSRL